MAARQVIGGVVFKDKQERKEIREFCRKHFNRTFSAQCRHMLLQAKREAKEAERAKRKRAA